MRGLDPDRRSQLGAQYTDRGSILRLVEPVLIAPLRREFEEVKAQIADVLPKWEKTAAAARSRVKAESNPEKILQAFLDRLASLRVLDPACGSGNFLYVALQCLKDLEREVIDWGALTLKTTRHFPGVGPQVPQPMSSTRSPRRIPNSGSARSLCTAPLPESRWRNRIHLGVRISFQHSMNPTFPASIALMAPLYRSTPETKRAPRRSRQQPHDISLEPSRPMGYLMGS